MNGRIYRTADQMVDHLVRHIERRIDSHLSELRHTAFLESTRIPLQTRARKHDHYFRIIPEGEVPPPTRWAAHCMRQHVCRDLAIPLFPIYWMEEVSELHAGALLRRGKRVLREPTATHGIAFKSPGGEHYALINAGLDAETTAEAVAHEAFHVYEYGRGIDRGEHDTFYEDQVSESEARKYALSAMLRFDYSTEPAGPKMNVW